MIDLNAVIEAMLGHGYSGYLVIEQAPPLNPGTLLDDMIRARTLFEPYERSPVVAT